MLTNFSVQAAVNDFYSAQRVFKDAGTKVLPQAVEADAIDVLAVQAPCCKGLPSSVTDLLTSARCSVLVFHNRGGDGTPLSGLATPLSPARSLRPTASFSARTAPPASGGEEGAGTGSGGSSALVPEPRVLRTTRSFKADEVDMWDMSLPAST
jgi:hypothetical protein